MSVDVDLARERTNPDDDPALPTQTLTRTGLALEYALAEIDPERRLWQWLGAPTVNAWAFRSARSQPDEDALLAGFDVDSVTLETGVALAFARERLTWSLQLNVVDYDDRSLAVAEGPFLIYEPPSDSRNVQTSLQASWAPASRLTLDAQVQHNAFDETDFDNEYRTLNFALSGTVQLVPKRLDLVASYTQGRDRSDYADPLFDDDTLRSRVANLQLNWRLRRAAGARPGISLYAMGSYVRNENAALLLDEERWSTYVGARWSWAPGVK